MSKATSSWSTPKRVGAAVDEVDDEEGADEEERVVAMVQGLRITYDHERNERKKLEK